MKENLKDKLDKLRDKKIKLESQIQQMEALHKQKAKKVDTRKKILIGSYFLKHAEENDNLGELKAKLDTFLTRDADRAIFDLPPLKEKKVPNV